jgi:hypothetical protein
MYRKRAAIARTVAALGMGRTTPFGGSIHLMSITTSAYDPG